MWLTRDSEGFTKKEGNYRLRVRRADKVGRYNVELQTLTVMKQRHRFVLSVSFIWVSRIFPLFFLRSQNPDRDGECLIINI
jgi:hypothetical protein